jgi:hypothetical protein
MQKVKPKKCKVCKTQYTPYSSLAQACSPKCALELVHIKEKKKIRKDLLEYRVETKKISDWIKEAQIAFNAYVRIRDYHDTCISSGKPDNHYANEFDAGHYRSVGSAPHLRFHLDNCHKQSKHDNNFLSGNIVEYRPRLLTKIGPEKLEALETNNAYRKFDREYCERVKRIFNKKTRMKKKRLGL